MIEGGYIGLYILLRITGNEGIVVVEKIQQAMLPRHGQRHRSGQHQRCYQHKPCRPLSPGRL